MKKIISGTVLSFNHNPFSGELDSSLSCHKAHSVVMDNGKIIDVLAVDKARKKYEEFEEENYGEDWISAGFIDCHVHFPQYEIIASYGNQLLEWLNQYVFPTEAKFFDPIYCRKMAEIFMSDLFRNGTTSAGVFCTIHPESVDAFFEESQKYQARMVAGKVCMDRHAPDNLQDDPQKAYDQSKALIEKWHGKKRLSYAISPRFAPTSTPEQLAAMGSLWKEFPELVMQTHLSENKAECEWVKQLFPGSKNYLEVYEKFGLLKAGALFGHGIYLDEDEKYKLYEAGAGIAHCPSSNLFLGSGLFEAENTKRTEQPITVGLATDIGGGSSLSMFNAMKSAYEISQLVNQSLHPFKLWYLATMGSSQALRIENQVGNIEPGKEADLVIINPKSTPIIENRIDQCSHFSESLFTQIMLADDRAIRSTYVGGNKVYG